MATTFEVALPVGTPRAVEAAEDALDLIDQLEDQLTIYRETSEVSRLNAHAADNPVSIQRNLFDLLTHAATLTNDTSNAFDIAVGASIQAWGFHKRQGSIPPPDVLKAARHASGMRHVLLNAENCTVKFRRAGLSINLGAIGKGYALDQAAERLQTRWGINSALLHGGGSSVRAIGRPYGHPRGWAIALRHPTDDSVTLGTVYLDNEGLGTSAATFQYFEYQGRKYGHLLDPRTGSPAQGTANASVIAPSATEADAISTAYFVLGAKIAVAHCLARPWLAAVLLPENDPDWPPVLAGLTPARYDQPEVREMIPTPFLDDES
jgi:FAD:protein FMN transferase